MTVTQPDLFAPTIAQRFEAWKATPGGGQILRRMYEITAGYFEDYRRYGTRVSQRLIWEMLRHRLDKIRGRLAKNGQRLKRESGYYLNDHFTAHAVRHMIENHPDWSALFELRELGKNRKKRTVIIIEEPEHAVKHQKAA